MSHLSATLIAAVVSINFVKRILWLVLLEVLFEELRTSFLKVGRHDGGRQKRRDGVYTRQWTSLHEVFGS